MSLAKYRQKRKFSKTPEPRGKTRSKERAAKWRRVKALHFVVQEHHATRLHYDFRLEMAGTLKSWAVPKGPTMDPTIKHLAVMVEDHPLSYRKFHGVIPEGNYGAGTVEIWDEGTYTPAEETDHPEKVLLEGLKKGDLKFILHGKKLTGKFVLVRTKRDEGKDWLLIKEKDTDFENVEVDIKKLLQKGKKTPMPHEVKPMLGKITEAPFDDPDFVYEMKWDGYRAIAEITKDKIRLYSRNNQNFTNVYPEVAEALKAFKKDAVLDGEIVAIDERGNISFQLLQDYKKNKHITLVYYVFDLLYYDGYDLRELSLIERKTILKQILPISVHVKYSDHIELHGVRLFALAKEKKREGIMAKRKNSRYLSDRSSSWQKIKNILTQEAVICGFTLPRGQRKEFGALILGLYENKKLRYIGHTGGGFDERKLSEVIKLLKPLVSNKCPFPVIPRTNMPATWVKPKIVVQVKFADWTKDGILRQPIFLGLRKDKRALEVTVEQRVQEAEVKIDNVELSNLDKVFWPKEGITKGDVITYYAKIAPHILPYLKDRPESLNRHPDGIEGTSFFQKDMLSQPKWVKLKPIYSESEHKTIHWLLCNDKETLLYMANLGCIEINPWNSRYQKINYPDYLILDLDPNGAPFKEVIKTALHFKEILDKVEIDSFVKTSGKTGLHILIPLGAKYTFEQTRKFAELLSRIAAGNLPGTSVARRPEKREKKIYLDFLQNRLGQTLAAPYSLRPVPGACVSTPLEWNELTPDLKPVDFTIKTIFKRLERKDDVWRGFLTHKGIDMLQSLSRLEKFIEG